MFEPGDIVECVDAKDYLIPGNPLVRGALYTVRTFYPPTGGVTLWEAQPTNGALRFLGRRFRLLKRRDPEMLHRLLHEPAPDIWTFAPDRERA